MSGSASLDLERQLLGHTLAIAPMPTLGRVYVALCLSAPTETAGGIEASGGGYSRMPATFALMSSPSNAASNAASVEFVPATSAWGTIGYFEIWTQVTGGTRLYWGPLTDPVDGVPIEMDVTTGDVVRFSAGALIVQAVDTPMTGSGVSSFNERTGAVTLLGADVTTALTYTPYNSTNPAGYQTAGNVTASLTPYATKAGTTTNDSAAAGQVGEFITSVVTGVALTTGAVVNLTSISLTAGDWDVWGSFGLTPSGGTGITTYGACINTVSVTFPANSTQTMQGGWPINNWNAVFIGALPVVRLSLASTTTVYLPAYASFNGTCVALAQLSARRAR